MSTGNWGLGRIRHGTKEAADLQAPHGHGKWILFEAILMSTLRAKDSKKRNEKKKNNCTE